MAIELVFETHSTTVDNEQGHATGWLPGQLSERGRTQARHLGRRRGADQITTVFSSDLTRAAQTASLAFGKSPMPVLYDWRLRECDYGQRNGMPVAELHAGRRQHLDRPYPGGESWRQAVTRVGRFLSDLPLRWNGQRVLVIGHVATRWRCVAGQGRQPEPGRGSASRARNFAPAASERLLRATARLARSASAGAQLRV